MNQNSIKIDQNIKESFNYKDSNNVYKEEKEKENTVCDSSNNILDLIKQETTHSSEENNSINILMNAVTSSNFNCTICSKQFSTKLKFEQHCLLHGINKQNSINCNNSSEGLFNNSLIRRLKINDSKLKRFLL